MAKTVVWITIGCDLPLKLAKKMKFAKDAHEIRTRSLYGEGFPGNRSEIPGFDEVL